MWRRDTGVTVSVEPVSAVLLAAGESRRMGATNKLSLSVDGEPLLRRTALEMLASRLGEIVVVLGHQPEVARDLLQGLPLTLVDNPHYREGQMTSVHCGLANLSRPAAGVMICLADQPRLERDDIDFLVDAYHHRCDRPVLVPTFAGQRGNPIILSYAQRGAILAGKRNLGCRRLIETHPELVWPCPVDSDHFTVDVDTPEDYTSLVDAHHVQTVAGAATDRNSMI